MRDADSIDVAPAIKRARMILSYLASPKPRAALIHKLTQGYSEHSNSGDYVPIELDWIAEGEVDTALLRNTADSLTSLLRDDLILRVRQLDSLPANECDRHKVSELIVRIVFKRLSPPAGLSEPELNSAIKMFVADAALVRRDCVDIGVLTRSSDGTVYQLAG